MLLRRVAPFLALAAFSAACDTVPPAESPAAIYPQTVTYNTNVYSGAGGAGIASASGTDVSAASRVAILPSSKLDRPSQVIGVVDVHEPMASEDAALERLRQKAAALGADAVLGVEFHHGEGTGEATHLSGLAVRYTTSDR